MIDLHDIRYVRLGTANLAQATEFATRIVGLQLVAREGKSAYFRSDRSAARGETRDHTLVYTEGDPSAHAVGFDLKEAGNLERVAAELERAGHPVRSGSAAECEARRGPGRHPTSGACFVYFEGPDGMVYEYSVGVKHIQPEEEAGYRPRQFPFAPESFCMWGSRPDIPEFRGSAAKP